MKEVFVGIETGGTKFVCAVGDVDGNLLDKVRISTRPPSETIPDIINYIHEKTKNHKLLAIGIATFGPVDLDPKSPYFGYVDAEQKAGWGHFDLVGSIKQKFPVPIGFDTDVNGAVLGEWKYGSSGKGLNSFAYWTIGTGIGAGFISNGQVMHGLVHPEIGHSYIPHDKLRDPFSGICPYHHDCLEGLASGPAIMNRWQIGSAMDLPKDHIGWEIEAEYLGYAMANCVLSVSPQRIILGGGVMQHEALFPKIRANTQKFLNNFIKHRAIINDIDEYIISPSLGINSGIYGAIALAQKALNGDSDVAIK